MNLVLSVMASVGWRGAAAAVVAAFLAYPAGRMVGTAVCGERIERALSQHDIKRMEMENAALRKAQTARRVADRASDSTGADGVPNDGFRRD